MLEGPVGDVLHRAPVLAPDSPERRRRRMGVLLGVTGVLLVACLVSYARLSTLQDAPDPRIPLAELDGEMPLRDAMVLGPLMYVKVSRDVWQGMSATDRVAHMNELGSEALERGCDKVYLTDDRSQHLATWTQKDGTQLQKTDKS